MRQNTQIARLLVVVSNSVKNAMPVADGCITSQFTAGFIMNARFVTDIPILGERIVEE